MVKEINFFLIFLLAITLVSAVELQPQQIGEDLEIYQECNNCTYCNFTRVMYGGENIFENIEATKDGTHYYFIIGGGNITEKDTLTYCYDCGNSAASETGCIDVPLTHTGHHLTTQTAILYLGFIVFLIFIFVLLLLSLSHLPKDVRDEEGFMLEVSKLAYLRPVVIGLCWILLTSIVYIASNIAIAYLDTGLLGSFLFWVFSFMFLSNLVILPLMVIRMIQRITLSKEMMGLIERGVQFT